MKRYLKYWVTILVGLLIALFVCLFKDIFHASTTTDMITIISDAFFTSAVCIGGYGIIVLISNEGNFDTLAYGFKILRNMWKKEENRKIEKDLFEYSMAKHEKRVPAKHLLYTGGGFFLMASIFTALFYIV